MINLRENIVVNSIVSEQKKTYCLLLNTKLTVLKQPASACHDTL